MHSLNFVFKVFVFKSGLLEYNHVGFQESFEILESPPCVCMYKRGGAWTASSQLIMAESNLPKKKRVLQIFLQYC